METAWVTLSKYAAHARASINDRNVKMHIAKAKQMKLEACGVASQARGGGIGDARKYLKIKYSGAL